MPPDRVEAEALDPTDLEAAVAQVGDGWRSLDRQAVFITGGTGFLGKWVLATLAHARRVHSLGCTATILSRDPDAFVNRWPTFFDSSWMTLLRGAVGDFPFPPAPHGCIIHAATDVAHRTNADQSKYDGLLGTRRVLEFARRSSAERVHVVSSGAVYGRQQPELHSMTEDQPFAEISLESDRAYTQCKRHAESELTQFASSSRCATTVSRCFSTIGPMLPLDGAFAAGNFIRDALVGRDITLSSDGQSVRSYLYTADMTAWIWSIALNGAAGAVYNIGATEAISIRSLAHRVASVLQSGAAIRLGTSQVPPFRYVPDVTRIQRELGVKQTVSLDEAIRRTARHYDQRRTKQ